MERLTAAARGFLGRPDGFDRIAITVMGMIATVWYALLPKAGDIWCMDASRHALNGAFVLDFLRAMPLHHPEAFALDYYRQWPALTILFYPPLFYVILALSYVIFGVSEAAALVPAAASLFLLGWGAYRLSRNWLSGGPALATAILTMAAPEVYFWGLQIMLDVPAYALLMWAAVFQVRVLKGGAPMALYIAVICAVAAMYIKYNAAFFVPVMMLSLLMARGPRFAISRTALSASLLGAVLMVPLLMIFFKFSIYDLTQAVSVQDAAAARWSFAGLTYYLRVMPDVLSWPTVILAIAYGVGAVFLPRWRLHGPEAVFLAIWLGFGYVFYTMIAVKEPRHILFVTYPIVLMAVLAVDRVVPWRGLSTLALAASVLTFSMVTKPAPYVTGMRQAAEDVARLAPRESNVAFWGRLDGTFTYGMRAYANRPDLGVVRLDKVLLGDLAIALDRGFTERKLNAEQITARLHDLHVQYVVAQTGYEDQLAVVEHLNKALHSDKFREVERIKMTSNYPFTYITELVVYRAVADVAPGRVAPKMDIKVINKSF